MSNDSIKRYINNYITNDQTGMAILLNGKWGSGKSFFIKNELVRYLEEKGYHAVVISLYGVEKVENISKAIFYEDIFEKHKKIEKNRVVSSGIILCKNIFTNLLASKGISIDISENDLDKVFSSVNFSKKLLIFEDFERSKIDICEIMGYISKLAEEDGAKILCVANEDEFIEYEAVETTDVQQDSTLKKSIKHVLTANAQRYVINKEKVFRDTIAFEGDLGKPLTYFMEQYRSNVRLFDVMTKSMSDLKFITVNQCRRNWRTIIKAFQKTNEIVDRINPDMGDEEFIRCILFSVINFYGKLTGEAIPKWSGTEYLSTSLGSLKTPLFKFVYTQIVNNSLDEEAIPKTIEAYQKYCFQEKNYGFINDYYLILDKFYVHTDKEVIDNLKELSTDLQNQYKVNIYIYSKVAYYMTYVAGIVGYDSTEDCQRMIENVKGISLSEDGIRDYFVLHREEIEIPEYKQKYEELMDAMVEAIKQSEIIFDYIPEHLDDLQNMVKNGLGREGDFLQKLNVNKLVEMLKICTSDQMYSFRSILRDVYPLQDNLSCNEEEKKLLLEFYKSILQLKNGFDAWDNIQRLNIDYLCSRLIQYLSAMGVEVESGSVG